MSNEEKKVIEMEDTQVSEEATEITAVSESKKKKVCNFIKKNGKKLGIGVGAGLAMMLCYALGKKSGHSDLEAMNDYVDGDYTVLDNDDSNDEAVEEN